MYVIFEDKGTNFPPIVTGFRSRRAAVTFILKEVADTKPHRMEPVSVDDARAWL